MSALNDIQLCCGTDQQPETFIGEGCKFALFIIYKENFYTLDKNFLGVFFGAESQLFNFSVTCLKFE